MQAKDFDQMLYEDFQQLTKDAMRYRWLRQQPNDTSAPRIDVVRWTENDDASNEGEGLRLEDLDAAIDKEMILACSSCRRTWN